jgi:hypothetical protein
MHGNPYPNADAVGEDSHFTVTIVGGAAFVFMALWLLIALEDSAEVEISVETYNNKRYGSHIDLPLSAITKGNDNVLAADCFGRLKNRSLYSPVFYIARLFDNMRDVLVPSKTIVRFGE